MVVLYPNITENYEVSTVSKAKTKIPKNGKKGKNNSSKEVL
jgi:hypothetical protein